MKPLIIPVFIPHRGCPHRCIFCDQKKSTGQTGSDITPDFLITTIKKWLSYRSAKHKRVEIACYGGTFTGLAPEMQEMLLSTLHTFIQSGEADSIRISTRPDTVERNNLPLLRQYGVETVELGVQSMNPEVLRQSSRGYTPRDVVRAVHLLREYGFRVGIQLMPGLPGDTFRTTMESAREVINLSPDFVRIYPTIVIKGTPLHTSYLKGEYHPLTLDQGVEWCGRLLTEFRHHKINVIRIGLQPTPSLEQEGGAAAGPYHPAFRHLVESSLAYRIMKSTIIRFGTKGERVLFKVPPAEVSYYIGVRRWNIIHLREKFGSDVSVVPLESLEAQSLLYCDGGQGGERVQGLSVLCEWMKQVGERN